MIKHLTKKLVNFKFSDSQKDLHKDSKVLAKILFKVYKYLVKDNNFTGTTAIFHFVNLVYLDLGSKVKKINIEFEDNKMFSFRTINQNKNNQLEFVEKFLNPSIEKIVYITKLPNGNYDASIHEVGETLEFKVTGREIRKAEIIENK